MTKDGDAFRTISEVAQLLDIPQHVLRFWEGKFPQVSPLKRGGGRRYYRPDEVDLLRAIRKLLYQDGYTIRGVQRLLKEHGVRAVALASIGQAMPVGHSDSGRVDQPEHDARELPARSDVSESVQIPLSPMVLRRSLVDVARELQACRSALQAARGTSTPFGTPSFLALSAPAG